MMPALPSIFLRAPIAHRGYHDLSQHRSENSISAMRAAMAEGYGIELDVQPSADGEPMVFHDDTLDRLTVETGPIRNRTAAELSRILLNGGPDHIPTLAEVLALVAGRVPLLIEIKDQDGANGPNVGPLEAAVAETLSGYGGPVALMSFNPHSMAAMARFAPQLPRGLVTCGYTAEDWPEIPAPRRAELAAIVDYDAVGACFISHQASDLAEARVAELKAAGAAVLCWTIRSAKAEEEARKIAQNVTFEQYPARNPS
ncbi:phosphodiesterase [Thioclava sp. BHET1]|nr:phosphodiesterase [Thioclava sp. BHET1]